MLYLKIILVSIFILVSPLSLMAQQKIQQTQESTNNKKKRNSGSYFTLAPRVGLGMHNYFNADIGLSLIAITNRTIDFAGTSLYCSYVVQQSKPFSKFDINGVKFGLQTSWNLMMCGIEVKTLYHNNKTYHYTSPKIGFSLMDVMTVEYLFTNTLPKNSPLNAKHHVSISICLNKKIYKDILTPWLSSS